MCRSFIVATAATEGSLATTSLTVMMQGSS